MAIENCFKQLYLRSSTVLEFSIVSYPAYDYESKNTFRHTIGVFSSVDRDKDHQFIIADLGPIVLKTLSPEETACNKIRFLTTKPNYWTIVYYIV